MPYGKSAKNPRPCKVCLHPERQRAELLVPTGRSVRPARRLLIGWRQLFLSGLWDFAGGAARVLQRHTDCGTALAVLPARRLASAGGQEQLFVADAQVVCLAQDAGRILAGCADGTIHWLRYR